MNLHDAQTLFGTTSRDPAVLKKRYHALMRRYHPDARGGSADEEICKKVGEAYRLLLEADPVGGFAAYGYRSVPSLFSFVRDQLGRGLTQ